MCILLLTTQVIGTNENKDFQNPTTNSWWWWWYDHDYIDGGTC